MSTVDKLHIISLPDSFPYFSFLLSDIVKNNGCFLVRIYLIHYLHFFVVSLYVSENSKKFLLVYPVAFSEILCIRNDILNLCIWLTTNVSARVPHIIGNHLLIISQGYFMIYVNNQVCRDFTQLFKDGTEIHICFL